jgi:hypothetical protein
VHLVLSLKREGVKFLEKERKKTVSCVSEDEAILKPVFKKNGALLFELIVVISIYSREHKKKEKQKENFI